MQMAADLAAFYSDLRDENKARSAGLPPPNRGLMWRRVPFLIVFGWSVSQKANFQACTGIYTSVA